MTKAIAILVILASSPLFAQNPGLPPPPGRLVDLGGRALHLHCVGTGAPTVVIESGASSFAIDWSLVQPEVATQQRVCAYDRAGMGWSDPRGAVDTHARIAADLDALLRAAGEKPPFVLVAASAGALYARLYQLDHPELVAGLVLVDPATENRLFTLYGGEPRLIAELSRDQIMETQRPFGSVVIRRRPSQTGAPFDRLPKELYDLRVTLDQRLIDSVPAAVSVEVVHESALGERDALARLLASRTSPDNPMRNIPVVVLTRGQDMTSGLVENHAELARLSDNSRQTVVADAGHEIHLFTPAAVIEAIRDVSGSIRERTRLPVR